MSYFNPCGIGLSLADGRGWYKDYYGNDNANNREEDQQPRGGGGGGT